MKNDVKKWSYFDDMAPKSGVPIWKRGFRGLCPLTGCTKGLVGTKCVSGEGREEARRVFLPISGRWNKLLKLSFRKVVRKFIEDEKLL